MFIGGKAEPAFASYRDHTARDGNEPFSRGLTRDMARRRGDVKTRRQEVDGAIGRRKKSPTRQECVERGS